MAVWAFRNANINLCSQRLPAVSTSRGSYLTRHFQNSVPTLRCILFYILNLFIVWGAPTAAAHPEKRMKSFALKKTINLSVNSLSIIMSVACSLSDSILYPLSESRSPALRKRAASQAPCRYNRKLHCPLTLFY